MKLRSAKRHPLWLDITVGLSTVAIIGVCLWFGVLRQPDDGKTCKTVGMKHDLIVSHDAFAVTKLTIKRCDTIKIANLGQENYDFALGVHDKHIEYPGFSMQPLSPNEFLVFDAVQAGTYTMHDHLRDQAHIQLVIKPK